MTWLGMDIKEADWLGLLQIIDETTMTRLMGRDMALYLKFLKYQALMFSAIFMFSFSFMIPLYYTGINALIYT